ncbi:MAG: protein-disulfide reductase DsbD N-terminal domain-containing protein [Flavobacteriaceae bacterium]|nr:protein-disulfide reductase DsbD N-terminal domain-containing protein [Flavobacteriaceae bacterium]
MKKLFLLICLLGTVFTSSAQGLTTLSEEEKNQIKNPVTWEGAIKNLEGDTYELSLSAEIEKDWHIYSQHTPNEDGMGPIPFYIEFKKAGEEFALEGVLEEGETHREYSETWGFDELFFKDHGKVWQIIKLNSPAPKVIKTILYYQVCKEVCLNEEYYVVFDIANNCLLYTSDAADEL